MQNSETKKRPEKILEVKDLHTYFFDGREKVVKAVEGLNLQLFRGEVLGIVGESGCGKSLTALSILQILPPGAKIIKGETTQAEILEIFGSPNIVTKNKSDNEVWNYNRMSFETATGDDGATLIFWGGSRALSTSTTKSFDLI